MNVDKHISELLFEHDCVIVPDLGGFVANYTSAKIHPVQHTFTPPSKNIVFNKNLKNNDGLLANHIVNSENTDYPQALKYISHFVDQATTQLRKGVKVKIEEVGTLFLDVERNVQFEPDTTVNHLEDAFGLTGFQSPAIKRETITKRIEKEFVDRSPIPAERKKINVKRVVALTLMIPLIAAMIWIPLKTDLLKNINYSDLNPFSSKEIVKPIKKDLPSENVLPVSVDTSRQKPVLENIQPVTTTMVEPVKADSTAVASKINLNFRFHLVAGCFMIEENALKFVAILKEQNLEAAIIGQNNKGLYVVSCGDYATRKDALNQLDDLRKAQPKAWLYKN